MYEEYKVSVYIARHKKIQESIVLSLISSILKLGVF